jgi:hypothetical protein
VVRSIRMRVRGPFSSIRNPQRKRETMYVFYMHIRPLIALVLKMHGASVRSPRHIRRSRTNDTRDFGAAAHERQA